LTVNAKNVLDSAIILSSNC